MLRPETESPIVRCTLASITSLRFYGDSGVLQCAHYPIKVEMHYNYTKSDNWLIK